MQDGRPGVRCVEDPGTHAGIRAASAASRNRSSCSLVVASSSSDRAKCVKSPRPRGRPPARVGRTPARPPVARPHTVHTRIDLHVDGHRSPCRGRETLEPPSEYNVGVSRCASATPSEPAGSSDSTSIGASIPAERSRSLFLDEGHPAPRGAGLDRSAGDLFVAVPVAVRLHHRHQLGGLGLQDAGVVFDRLQVHLDPRGSKAFTTWRSLALHVCDRVGHAIRDIPREGSSPRSLPANSPARPWR